MSEGKKKKKKMLNEPAEFSWKIAFTLTSSCVHVFYSIKP